ncbi:MAG: ATP-binding protein, partial [Lysinibacillus sp.]
MREEIVNPVVGNFVKSLRDIGYIFEVAVADILDNSITAGAENIKILCLPEPEVNFSILDDGWGMNEEELINAMRLATHDPDRSRDPNDLGKFGLGLKTASFSQCRKLTVLSKRNDIIAIKQWDLDYISEKNEWLLVTPKLSIYETHPLYLELSNLEYGTLVMWESIDSFRKEDIALRIEELHHHLSLVFHFFLEGKVSKRKRLNLTINGAKVEPFNPFNPTHKATQEFQEEKIYFNDYEI